jgi:HSP20 family molecular chaperone IbpA
MLMRFDPFREVDRTAEQLTQRLTSPGVPFDAVRRGNKVILNFDLPGVAEDFIDLTVERQRPYSQRRARGRLAGRRRGHRQRAAPGHVHPAAIPGGHPRHQQGGGVLWPGCSDGDDPG